MSPTDNFPLESKNFTWNVTVWFSYTAMVNWRERYVVSCEIISFPVSPPEFLTSTFRISNFLYSDNWHRNDLNSLSWILGTCSVRCNSWRDTFGEVFLSRHQNLRHQTFLRIFYRNLHLLDYLPYTMNKISYPSIVCIVWCNHRLSMCLRHVFLLFSVFGIIRIPNS